MKNRSEITLRDISFHLDYEVLMLTDLAFSFRPAPGTIAHNAYIEAFVMHLRNLLDFIWKDRADNDWVLAVHFFNDSKMWTSRRPVKSVALENAHRRAHKEVSHLSYDRSKTVGEDEKIWDMEGLTRDLLPALFLFRELVPKNLLDDRCQWFHGKSRFS